MNQRSRFCDGVNRRDLLRLGVAGFVGGNITLSEMLKHQAHAAGSKKDVSLIILFLKGGLSTIDTLDLKPEAPPEFRGEFQQIETNVSGVKICEHLPLVAQQADKFALVRNFTHNNSGHGSADHYMLTGYNPRAGFNSGLKPNNQFPSHGSNIAFKLGPKGSIPPYVCLPKMHNSGGASHLGSSAAPFVVDADPNSPNFSVPDLAPPLEIGTARLDARKRLMEKIDRYRKGTEVSANSKAQTLNTFQEKAFDLITSDATKTAFDIGQESDKMRDQYGRNSLGQSCLMARRLVESGVRCVTINHTNWDTHYNNFHVLKNDLLPHLDSGLSTMLKDMTERGMLDSTLVLVMGEFGRTPRVNKYAGRDHWGPSNCLLMAGGGIRGGVALGKTNPRGEKPAADPVGPEDLAATIYRCIGIDGEEQHYTPEGRPVKIVNNGRAIEGIL